MGSAEQHFSRLLWRSSLTGVFLGGAGTLYFLLGIAGYLSSPAVNLFLAAALAVAMLFFLQEFFRAVSDTSWAGRWLWAGSFLLLIATLLMCTLPPTARDELTHHLSIPRLYIRAGRIIEVPMAPYSYYPMLLDMFYTPWIGWRLDSIPKVIHALFGYLTGLLIYAYLGRRINEVYGSLGFLVWISIPCIIRSSHWAYVDLGLVFYTLTALLCLLRWCEEQDDRRWLGIAGLSAGFAFATKPNGLVTCFLLFAVLAYRLARDSRSTRISTVGNLALFSVATILPCIPWLAKNFYQTANPFFPFFGSLFSARGAAVDAPALYVALGVFAKRDLLYGESLPQILALPVRLFLFGQDDNPQYFDGVLSPILLLFIPWAFRGRWIDEKYALVAFAGLYLAYALFLVDLRARYVLPIVPPLVILLVYGVFNIHRSCRYPVILYGLLLLFAIYHGYYGYRYLHAAAPIPYLLGDDSRAAYLRRALPEYAAFEFVNRQLPADARVYLLFIGRRGYYCERDYIHDGGDLPALLQTAMDAATAPADIAESLGRFGITHLMARTDLLARYLVENLPPTKIALWNEFARTRLALNYQAHGYALYRLHE